MASNKVSLLFRGMRQTINNRAKSTFVYEADRTASQKWIENRIVTVKKNQKLHGADDGIPIWWKSTTDKVLTTFVFASTVACFLGTITNLVKFSQGKL